MMCNAFSAWRVAGVLLGLAGLSVPAAAQEGLPPAGCEGEAGWAGAGARTFLWRPAWLATTAKDAAVRARLQALARAAMRRAPDPVTGKGRAPPGGTAQDYWSIGPYWWPASDPALPYVRRDGQVNPQRGGPGFDSRRLQRMAADVEVLALAAHILGDRAAADHAAAHLRAWFIDPQTRMNPDMRFAQGVPGHSEGRPEGIIDAVVLVPVVEAIGLLDASGALSAAEQAALERWFGAFAAWLETSPAGVAEAAKANNHGLHRDVLVAQFGLFARTGARWRAVINDFAAQRIDRQIAADGRLPEELTRTRSWHYTNYALLAAVRMASLAQCAGIDLWRHRGPQGQGIAAAVRLAAGVIGKEQSWPWPEQALADPQRLQAARDQATQVARLAAWGLQDPQLEGIAAAHTHADASHRPWLAPYPIPADSLKISEKD